PPGTAALTITDGSGFPLPVEFKGGNRNGTATIGGTPIATESETTTGTPTDANGAVAYTISTITFPTTVRTGDAWTITLTNPDGSSPVTVTKIPASTSGSALATAFTADAALSGFGPQADHEELKPPTPAGFTVRVSAPPAGTLHVDQTAQPTARTISILAAFEPGDTWTVSLTGTGLSTTAPGGSSTDAVAANIASAINLN